MSEPEAIVKSVQRRLKAYEGDSRLREMVGEEVAFGLELDQYEDPEGETRDAYLVQPVDRGSLRLWTHNVAVTRQSFPINLSVQPIDQQEDPNAASLMRWALEHDILNNRTNGFRETRKRYIGAAHAMRVGCARLDWRPEVGEQGGEVIPILVDMRNMFFRGAYLWPHHPLNPDLIEVCRIPLDEAKRMRGWDQDVVKDLLADDGSEFFHEGGRKGGDETDAAGNVRLSGTGRVRNDNPESDEDDMVSIALAWSRFDTTAREGAVPLPDGERYMQCISCKDKSPTQLAADESYPKIDPLSCPQCAGDRVRVDRRMATDGLRYLNGKRLTIVALNKSVQRPLYDDNWPVPKCPTFPYLWLPCVAFPHKAVPESDISSNWSGTLGRNFTMRTIYQQAHRSRPITLLPEVGLKNRTGHNFDIDTQDDDVAYYGKMMSLDPIKTVQAQPVSESLFQLHELLNGSFRENEGSNDVSLAPGQSRDIPVGSLQQQIESGSYPINMFGEDLYDAESPFFTCWGYYIQAFWTDERWIRTRGVTGKQDWLAVSGIGLPDSDVTVSSGPNGNALRTEDMKAMQLLMGAPPEMRELIGRVANVDRGLLDQISEAEAAARARVAATMPPTPGGRPSVPSFPSSAPGGGVPPQVPQGVAQ